MAVSGITSSHDWVEGNRNGANAQDCEVCSDSSQTVGSGTCATKTEWAAANATGAGDTLGICVGDPEDSTISGGNQIFAGNDFPLVAGDSIYFYLDTTMCNLWQSGSDNNGFGIYIWGGPSDQYYATIYGSESNCTGCADSIPYITLFGHTVTAGELSGRRRRILGGQR
jgi:hypothetical protein